MNRDSIMHAFLTKLGEEILDVDEETFDLFSQSPSSQDLGMVDAAAPLLEISVAGRDFEIAQSPGLLQSSRGGGTTGAAVWKSSIRLAEWLAWDLNPLFTTEALHAHSTILELGSGISGLVPCILSPKVSKVVATDQAYVLKALRDNIASNSTISNASQKRKPGRTSNRDTKDSTLDIDALALDWENDDVASVLKENDLKDGVDAVLSSDCIYNYALVEPLVQTCVDICRLRRRDENPGSGKQQTICVVAQQLRQPDVFEQWLGTFHRSFRVWRMPEDLLSAELREGSGFVVHVGVLRVKV